MTTQQGVGCGTGCELGFIKFQSLDSQGISEHMCWTKAKRHQAKRRSDQQRLQRRLPEVTAEASRGNQSSNGAPGSQKHSDWVGEGQREPWTWPRGRGERLDTHTFCCGCIFLAYLPAALKSLLPSPWFPSDPWGVRS